MESKEKLINRFKLGIAIKRVIEKNKNSIVENSATSLRKLAAASGVEYAIIQKITSGQKDPQFTTLLSVADGLNIAVSELLLQFESISEEAAIKQISESQKKRKKKN